MRYWIYDRDDTPQQYPLQRLLFEVRARMPELGGRVFVHRVWAGYGLRAKALSDASEQVPRLEVGFSELAELCEGREEWFFDIEIQDEQGRIKFGLFDSTCLFVEGEESLVRKIAAAFTDVRVAE